MLKVHILQPSHEVINEGHALSHGDYKRFHLAVNYKVSTVKFKKKKPKLHF